MIRNHRKKTHLQELEDREKIAKKLPMVTLRRVW